MRAVVLPGHDGFIEAHYCEVRGMPRSRRQPQPGLAWSRKLGAAATELLWALAADAPSVVADERAVAVWR